MKTLLKSYSDILKENHKWNPTRSLNIDHAFPNVLKYPDSYNFIFGILFSDSNIHSLSLSLYKYYKSIPEERYSHTVSLYLLGIQVAGAIGFDRFNLPRWDDCSQRNFLHHWAATCLFHDVAYCIETDHVSFPPEKYQTINTISENLGLQYNLISKDNTGLIENYYQHRITTSKPKIDHGIVGAMMLYDSLMRRNSKMEEIVFSVK